MTVSYLLKINYISEGKANDGWGYKLVVKHTNGRFTVREKDESHSDISREQIHLLHPLCSLTVFGGLDDAYS